MDKNAVSMVATCYTPCLRAGSSTLAQRASEGLPTAYARLRVGQVRDTEEGAHRRPLGDRPRGWPLIPTRARILTCGAKIHKGQGAARSIPPRHACPAPSTLTQRASKGPAMSYPRLRVGLVFCRLRGNPARRNPRAERQRPAVARRGARAGFDLPHSLAADGELLADLLERAGAAVAQPEVHQNDLPVPALQFLHDRIDLGLQKVLVNLGRKAPVRDNRGAGPPGCFSRGHRCSR